MSAEGEHGKILAIAAKSALGPLGFRRQGRSRLWMKDCGFWLCIVEFQPSGFSKGSYLNIAAHWLWSPDDYLTFDYMPKRQKPWINFETHEQFTPLAYKLAETAAYEVAQLEARFPDIGTAAKRLIADEDQSVVEKRGGGWPAFNAAIAAGLSGDVENLNRLFGLAYETLTVCRPDFTTKLDPYRDTLGDEAAFHTFISHRIDLNRRLKSCE